MNIDSGQWTIGVSMNCSDPPAQRDRLASGNGPNLPRRSVEMFAQAWRRIFCRTAAWPEASRASLAAAPGVVQLGVVADDVIHPRRIDQRSNVPQHSSAKGALTVSIKAVFSSRTR